MEKNNTTTNNSNNNSPKSPPREQKRDKSDSALPEKKKRKKLTQNPTSSEAKKSTSRNHLPEATGLFGTLAHVLPLDTSIDDSEEDRHKLAALRMEKRDQLMNQLLVSEQKHVEELKTLVVDYMMPLSTKQVIPRQAIKNLFCNFELIMGWNMQWLNYLKTRLESGDGCFGHILVEMFGILRQLYSEYSGNYETAQQTYRECMKTKEFETFIQNQTKQKSTNLLTSLYLPIQRMIMYDSLLKEIIGCTSNDHPDYEDLCNALRALRSISKVADRVAEKRKNMDMVIKIQNQLNNWELAEPHRKYIHEDDILLQAGPKNFKERKMYLFNDVLLVTRKKGKKFDVHFMIRLDAFKVVDIEGDRDRFKIEVIEDGTEYLFSSSEKHTWIQLLNSAKIKLKATPDEVNHLRVEEQEGEEEKESIKKFSTQS